jgi:hypothetical protein
MREVRYWVMFERDREPTLLVTRSLDELMDQLAKGMRRGPIEWMQRAY